MKTPTKSLLTAAAVAALTMASAGAAIIANYGGDYVTANQPGNRSWTGGGGSDYIVTFSDTSKLSPNSGYTGPVYYGGAFRGSWTVTTGGNTNVVNNADGSNDVIQLDNGSGTSAINTGYAGLIFFKKANFLNGGDTNQVNIIHRVRSPPVEQMLKTQVFWTCVGFSNLPTAAMSFPKQPAAPSETMGHTPTSAPEI